MMCLKEVLMGQARRRRRRGKDVQSWWEVPCIAHFCSLFRSSFGLLDFDIEDLEEALLTHTVEEVGSSLIQDLIVRLLKGCFNSNKDEITSSNYQMYLRRLFRFKCEEDHKRKNPFDKDVAFHSLPLRTKVEILYDLCDFRLDGDEVQEVLKSLESHSLRVTALGKDSGGSTYWYFYGTRLYREDYSTSPTSSPVRKRGKKSAEALNNPFGSLKDSKWQVVCYTEEDWQLLTRKFKNCKSKHERSLHRTLKEDFLPELPRLFAEKEKLQRKRMMEQQLRRSGRNNVTSEGKSGSDEPSGNQPSDDMSEDELRRQRLEQEKADRLLAEEMQREERKARIHLRERRGGGGGSATSGANSSSTTRSGGSTTSGRKSNESKANNRKRMTNNSMAACLPPVMEIDSSANSVCSGTPRRDSSRSPSPSPPPPPPPSKSRTPKDSQKDSQKDSSNSSVSSAKKKKYDDPVKYTSASSNDNCSAKDSKGGTSKTKVRSSVIFSQNEEDVIIGMHKVIEGIKNHRDAWPFVNPVDEDYAPNYYRVISEPMDLQAIEDKLDNQEYSSLEEFRADFQKIVDNCRKYNGPSSEYTEMVETLQDAFNKAIQRNIIPDESDEEISIEYNTGNERKKPRMMNSEKKPKPGSPKTTTEHKKENEPEAVKKSNSKSKSDKHDKKKRKQQLMRHHSRNSEAMDALTSATAETLKDINKWLGDAPKISEYSPSSPQSISSENLVLHPEKNEKKIKPAKSNLKDSKAVSKRKLLKNGDRDDDPSSPLPSSERVRSKEKIKSKKSKLKERLKGKDSAEASSGNGSGKEGKAKHHHHHYHKHHRHHKNHSSNASRSGKERSKSPDQVSSVPATPSKSVKGQDSSKSQLSRSHSPLVTASKSLSQSQSGSQWDNDKNDSSLKKHPDTVKSKSSVKRATSLMMGLKNSNTIKRLQGNKLTKYSSLGHQESKAKVGASGNASSVYDFDPKPSYSKPFNSGPEFGNGSNSSVTNNGREVSEKKKCLLINDSPNGKEGGPKLSLGSVLSTDAIKLGNFKKENNVSDEDDGFIVKEEGKYDRFDDLKAKINSKVKTDGGADEDAGTKGEDDSVSVAKEESEDVEVENDRKLEPSKGFNREKCMPNLSAWIKAFGGPPKTAASNVQTTPTKKPEGDPKSKFKVLGRPPLEPQDEKSKQSSVKLPPYVPAAAPPAHSKSKSRDNVKFGATNSRGDYEGSAVDDMPPAGYESHGASSSSKKHRSRKMSSSSLSSQSESGSPSCFPNNQDDLANRMVINPPRWVEEHWGPQSQSPSASSQVSSHSPAGPNSPFSPPMSSPPRTPQTPPWPPAPVRVGFYQDLTSQHSSPEKISESNVASPATPPSVTGSGSGGGTPSNRDSGSLSSKNYPGYPAPGYAPRYASSIPSPNMGPGSGIPSPSPGVDSPGSRMSMGPHGSPHSPSIAANSGPNHPSDYSRVTMNPSPSGIHHPMSSQPLTTPSGPPSGGSIGQAKLPASSPGVRSSSRGDPMLNAHSIPPYPVTTVSGSGNFMMDGPHPEAAHMHHHQASGPPRYPQNLPPAHHQPVSLSQSPGLSSVSVAKLHNHVLGPQGLPPGLTSSSSQPQPSPYPTNPYTSNPRSINVAPSVYNNPMDSRYYKPGGDIGLSGTPPSVSTSGSSGSSKSKKNSAVSHGNEADGGGSKSSSSNSNSSPAVSSAATAAAALESAKLNSELNGFQWPHNLASLSQIVNSIPNPMAMGMGVPGIANAYRAHYDKTMATAAEMGKYARSDSSPSYTNLAAVSGKSTAESNTTTSVTTASQPEKSLTPNEERRSSSKSESKSSRSQGSSSKSSTSQPIVPGSAFNFSALAPDLALDPSSLYTASPPTLAHHHRPDLYPTSSANFHSSFAAASAARTTAGGVPTASIAPYQIPPFIGSHASPYQPQSVSSQPFAHSQAPRGIVDPYQQFFTGSPHVMGLLPPSSYSAPYGHPHHSLGFNRPGWI